MKQVCAASIEVGLPADAVFAFVADLARWPVWLSFVVCAQQHGEPQPRALAAGQEIDVCVQRGKRRSCEQFEVANFVTGAFVCLEGSLSASRRIEFRLEQRRKDTRVHARVGYPVFGGALGWLRDGLFTRRALLKQLRRSLAELKSALEDGERVTDLAGRRASRGEEAASGSAKQTATA